MVGLAFRSRSSDVTSHPSSAKAWPIDPVPENSKRRIGVFHVRLQSQPHQRYKGRAPAGWLEVAQSELTPAETLHVLIKKPSVRPPQVCGRLEHGACLAGRALFIVHHQERRSDQAAMELVLGEVQSHAKGGKFLPIKGKDGDAPVLCTKQRAAVVWEPSAYVEGDRVNVCLEATQELTKAASKWESAAVRLADAAPRPMFGEPLSRAQMQDRFQSCLKTSPQGLRFVKLKATMCNVRFWNAEGKRTKAPSSLRGRKILAAFQARQV